MGNEFIEVPLILTQLFLPNSCKTDDIGKLT